MTDVLYNYKIFIMWNLSVTNPEGLVSSFEGVQVSTDRYKWQRVYGYIGPDKKPAYMARLGNEDVASIMLSEQGTPTAMEFTEEGVVLRGTSVQFETVSQRNRLRQYEQRTIMIPEVVGIQWILSQVNSE